MNSTTPGSPVHHDPVLADRVVELLAPALAGDAPLLVDGTLGLGGHAEAFLTRFPHLTLVGIDRDPAALEHARARLAHFADRFAACHGIFDELADITAAAFPGRPINAILLDLGVSSMQLDDTSRGFSYARESGLDMRMDPGRHLTAAEIVNSYPESELARIIRTYGDERFAARIAARIVAARPITSSVALAELVRDAIPAAARRTGGNPAKRTFQALRIEVNDELAVLARAVPAALAALALGGRLAIMSYHSGEDRIVKHALAAATRSSAPPDLPIEPPGSEPRFAAITTRAITADPAEQLANPRSASVRMRIVERIREGTVTR